MKYKYGVWSTGGMILILNLIEDIPNSCCTISEAWQVRKVQIYENVFYRAAFD